MGLSHELRGITDELLVGRTTLIGERPDPRQEPTVTEISGCQARGRTQAARAQECRRTTGRTYGPGFAERAHC
jgi:hypothetical protein